MISVFTGVVRRDIPPVFKSNAVNGYVIAFDGFVSGRTVIWGARPAADRDERGGGPSGTNRASRLETSSASLCTDDQASCRLQDIGAKPQALATKGIMDDSAIRVMGNPNP